MLKNVLGHSATPIVISFVVFMTCWAGRLYGADLSGGMHMIATEQYTAAEQYFRDALEKDPADPDIFVSLAKLYLAEGNVDKGLEYAIDAKNLAPKSASNWILLAIAYKMHLDQVSIFSKLSVARKILASLKQAVNLEPGDAEAHYMLAQYYIQAPSLFGGGRDKADEQIVILRRLDPARAERALAGQALHENDNNIAQQHFLAAIKLDTSPASGFEYGIYLMQLHRFDEAANIFRDGIAHHPAYSDTYYELGVSDLMAKDHVKEGIQSLKQYISMPHSEWRDPIPYKWAHYRLGMLYGMAGDKSDERVQYEEALKLDNNFKEAKEALAAM